MNESDIHEYLNEFKKLHPTIGENDNNLAEVALFIEDTFNYILKDSEICSENLGSHRAIAEFIHKRNTSEDTCAGSAV
jgi:hypothetical protein